MFSPKTKSMSYAGVLVSKKKKKSGGWRSTAVPEQAVVGNDPGPNEKEKAPQRRLSLIPAIEKASTGCTEHLDKVTEEKPLRVIK